MVSQAVSREQEVASSLSRLLENRNNVSEIGLIEGIKKILPGKVDSLPGVVLIQKAEEIGRLYANFGNYDRDAFARAIHNVGEELSGLNRALSEPADLKGMFFKFVDAVNPKDKIASAINDLSRLIENRGNLDTPDFDRTLRSFFKPECRWISTDALVHTVNLAHKVLLNRQNMDQAGLDRDLKTILGNSLK